MGGFDEESQAVRKEYDWSKIAPSEAVIDAIASVEGVEPVSLSTQQDIVLYDYVDPEAFDTLLTGGTPPTITFSVGEYRIQIDGSGLIICHG